MDTRKQVQALIPNIIHSLDACHLINVINNINGYIIPVHDCFGTHPNDMSYLGEIIRVEFIKLYTNPSFLQSLHDKILVDIKSYGFEIKQDDSTKYVELNKRKIVKVIIPNLPPTGDLDLNLIIKSKYMIS